MIKVGCVLEATHNVPARPYQNEPIDLPHVFEAIIKHGEELQKARIITIYISESQAEAIVKRLWPHRNLLGATSGKGFHIESAEQVSVVNEILAPNISIEFNPEKHYWMLQTWPE